jgi:MATE family multidrug resistance protein
MAITEIPATSLNQRIWRIAWPATLSNISIPLLALVDAAILGHLESPAYLGAVAVGGAILSFLYWGFSFLRMGTTGLVARAYGARDEARDRQVLVQSMALALMIGLTVVLLHPVLIGFGLALMDPGASILSLATSYTGIRVYSAPAVLLTYTVTGWFIGHQNTRWPLLFVLLTNGLNALLDVFFIIGLGMHSDGAAFATLIAEYAGAAVALSALLYHSGYRPDTRTRAALLAFAEYRTFLSTSRHLFVRTLCLMFCFAFFTAQSAHFGASTLAANTIILNLLLLAAYGLDGLAHASEALCGSAVGAGRMDEFYSTCRACAQFSLTVACAITGFFWICGDLVFPLFTDLPEVLALFPVYKNWLLFLPLATAGSYLLDGIFIGTSRTQYMYYTMLVSAFLVYLPSWYLSKEMGNHGLWLAFTLFNLSRGVGLGFFFWLLSRRGLWLH